MLHWMFLIYQWWIVFLDTMDHWKGKCWMYMYMICVTNKQNIDLRHTDIFIICLTSFWSIEIDDWSFVTVELYAETISTSICLMWLSHIKEKKKKGLNLRFVLDINIREYSQLYENWMNDIDYNHFVKWMINGDIQYSCLLEIDEVISQLWKKKRRI
jgi:hypothetical protein